MAKKKFIGLMWVGIILSLIVGIAVGGLFLGTPEKKATAAEPAMKEVPAITLSNPLLGWLGESVHTIVGWLIIGLTLFGGVMSGKELLK